MTGAPGLCAVDPVGTNYVFGSPLLNRAEIAMGNQRKLVVKTIDNGPQTPYIQSVTFNGKPWTRSWISPADLGAGGELVFHMGATPNRKFGAAREDRPPSFGAAMPA